MLQKLDGVGFQSTLLSHLDGVVHGFSCRKAGDMRYEGKNRKRFISTLGLRQSPVFAQQTHGYKVPGDGLVSNTFPVAVVTADCAPVLLVDPESKVFAAVHAGWKGTLGGVIGNAIQEMVRIGADARGIYAALGQHIGLCCYNVPEDRVRLFEDRFGRDEKMAARIDGRWHLDIGWANYRQLLVAGVTADHIDAPPTCTSCQNNEFYSFRRDTKETFGKMMAVIGFDNNHHCVVETGLKPVSTVNRSKRIYFVGIKGVAMTALAIWAKESGKIVAGSDVGEEFPTDEELMKSGITVHEGFDESYISVFSPDLVIYTGAHGGRDNPQVVYANGHAIPSLPHGQALGLAMQCKRQISVAGSHGKTTTAAMIATILTEAGLDPSYAIGCGSIRGLGAAGHAGKGEWFVAEADEYVTDPGHDLTPRFLWQKPDVLVVTNIDYDHPDVYPDLLAVQQAFVKLQKQSTLTFVRADDEASLVLRGGDSVVTFGPSEKLNELKLQIPGKHNLFNAAAAIAVCGRIGIAWETVKRGLEHFGGTKRRFEKLGEVRGALIYDDYAHHPKEIEATIAAFRDKFPKKRLIVVFQPHTYSRTKALLTGFTRALARADVALVTDIYASARETQTEEGLAKRLGGFYTPTRKDVSEWLYKELKEDDIVVFMGAGDIYQWAKKMI